MSKKKVYVNPALKNQTMKVLADYKKEHPKSNTPMFDVFNQSEREEVDKVRFMRAARALGWNVCTFQRHAYENGVLIW